MHQETTQRMQVRWILRGQMRRWDSRLGSFDCATCRLSLLCSYDIAPLLSQRSPPFGYLDPIRCSLVIVGDDLDPVSCVGVSQPRIDELRRKAACVTGGMLTIWVIDERDVLSNIVSIASK